MKQYPMYLRATILLLFFTLLFSGLYFAQSFLIPFCLAAFLSILLQKPVRWMERRLRIPSWAATLLAIVFVMLIIVGLFYLLYSQIMIFVDQTPMLKAQINVKLDDIQSWIRSQTG